MFYFTIQDRFSEQYFNCSSLVLFFCLSSYQKYKLHFTSLKTGIKIQSAAASNHGPLDRASDTSLRHAALMRQENIWTPVTQVQRYPACNRSRVLQQNKPSMQLHQNNQSCMPIGLPQSCDKAAWPLADLSHMASSNEKEPQLLQAQAKNTKAKENTNKHGSRVDSTASLQHRIALPPAVDSNLRKKFLERLQASAT